MQRWGAGAAIFVVLAVGVAVGATPAAAATTTLPPAPFLESVSPQGLGVLASWAPDPASSEVTSYSVEALPAPGTKPPAGCSTVTVSVSSTNTAAVVGGLCKEVAYVARVSAFNAVGHGAWSPNSNPFAPFPAQVPGEPLVTSVLGREKSLVVSWSTPASSGGAPISGYVVKASAASSTVSVEVASTAGSATIAGLEDGTSYSVSVVAKNSVGLSPAGTATGVPRAAYAPGAPSQITAAPTGTGSIAVSWQPPADDGGAAISAYRVTYQRMVRNSNGEWEPAAGAEPVTESVSATTTSLTVPGLSPANAFWSFSVAAVNSGGAGTASSAGQPVAPQTTVNAGTVVLSTATMEALSSDTNGKLTWQTAPSQLGELKAGEVIVAAPAPAAPQGLLDTVQSVTKTAGGGYTVGITQAALSKVFSGLSLAGTLNPLASGEGQAQATFHPALPGVRLLPQAPAAGVAFSQDITLGISYGAGPVKVSGELDITPSVAIDLALTHGFLGVPDGASITAKATVSAKAALVATLHGSLTKKLGEIDGAPEDYQVGPVPVIVVPKIPIFLTASGQISAEVSASITLGAQASWSSQHPGSLAVKNLSTPLSVSGNPLDNVSATASIGLQEQPQLDLYDAAGPNFEAEESIQANLNPDPQPGQDYFTLGPALSLKAGWDVDLLSFHASLEDTIAKLFFPAFVIAAPPTAFLTVSPGNQAVPVGANQQFTATRSDGQSLPVTWSVLGGAGDTISSSGQLQTVAPAGRTLTVVATDSSGASGYATVTVGQPFDPPQELQASSSHDGRSATLSWQPPENTGGAAVSSYTVVTEPQTTRQTVSATGATLTGLSPGVTYVVSVYATNANGLHSAPATISFTPAVSCTITWTGAKSSAWSTAANWSANRVPNGNDLVCIESGTVNLTSGATLYGLTLRYATLNVTGAVSVTDLLALQGGVLRGSGTASVTAPAGSTLAISESHLVGIRLVNHGEGSLAGPGISTDLEEGAVLENASTLTVADGASIGWDGSSAAQLVNDADATITYTGGAEGLTVSVPVSNSGAIVAGAGTLNFTAAVSQTSTGSFSGPGEIVLGSSFSPVGSGVKLADVVVWGSLAGPGTVTVPAGGAVEMATGARLTGGLDLVNRGTLTLGPPESAASYMTVEGATTLENAGVVKLAGGESVEWDGNPSGRVVNDAGATITYPGGGEAATIGVPVRNRGTISAATGTLTLDAPVTQTSTGSFAGAGTIVLQSTFAPSGTEVQLEDVTVAGSLVGPGTVTIPSGGAVEMTSGARLAGIDLVNRGLLTVGSGTSSYISIEGTTTLENAGTLTLLDGASIDWDGSSGGRVVNDAGATISYPGGSAGATVAAPVLNSGTISATAGTLSLTARVSQTSSGSFAGTGAIVLQSDFAPVGVGVSLSDVTLSGRLLGPGTVTVPSGGLVQTTSGARLTGVDLVNRGTLVVGSESSSYLTVEGATIENTGTLTIADGASIDGEEGAGEQLVNDVGGTIDYPGGSRGAAISLPFDDHGAVSVGAGRLEIGDGNTVGASDTGSYSVSGGGTVDFARGERVLGEGFGFQGPGQLEVGGGILEVPGAASISNLAVTAGGQLEGPGSVTIPSGGQLTFGGAHLTQGVTVVNDGSATIAAAGDLYIEGGSALQNAGTLQLADGSEVSYAYSRSSGQLIDDAGGTISYAGGSLGARIDVSFDDYGTVSANVGTRGGTLYISAGNTVGASDTGNYSASSGGYIDFTGGERVLGKTFAFQGPGQFDVGGGVVDVPGAVSISNLAVNGGGQLDGPGSVTVPSGGKLTLGGVAYLAGGLRLVNQGAGTVTTGNALYIEGGSVLENAGTLQLADGATVGYVYSPTVGEIINATGATLSYPGGTQGARIDVLFGNLGKVAANVGTRGGTLWLEAGDPVGVSDTGTYSATSGGTIDLAGGQRVLGSTFHFQGAGQLEISYGSVEVPGAVSISNLAIATDGQLDGPGTVTVPSTGKLALGDTAYLSEDLKLVNDGSGTVQTGQSVYLEGGSTLQNNGSLQLADGSDIAYPYYPISGQLVNESAGTVSYLGGTDGAAIGVTFENYGAVAANVGTQGGTLRIESGDPTNAADTGSYSASAGGAIAFAGGERVLASKAKLNGPGEIEIDGGRVVDSAIASGPGMRLQGGRLELTPQATGELSAIVGEPSGTLQVDLSSSTPTSEPARLTIAGEAALGGRLVLQAASGFAPPAGTTLALLEYGSKSGEFSAIEYTASAGGFLANVGSKALTARFE